MAEPAGFASAPARRPLMGRPVGDFRAAHCRKIEEMVGPEESCKVNIFNYLNGKNLTNHVMRFNELQVKLQTSLKFTTKHYALPRIFVRPTLQCQNFVDCANENVGRLIE